MAKQNFKPGNMLYPLPAVLVSVADKRGNSNLLTIAWTGTVCSDPPMVSISVRPERYSYHMIDRRVCHQSDDGKTCPRHRLLRCKKRQRCR